MKSPFVTRLYLSLIGMSMSMSLFAADKTEDKGPLLNEPMGVGNIIQMLLGLTFIVVLIIGMAWLMRRMGTFQATAAGELKVLGGLSVGQRERVVLIQAGEKQILVGVAPGRVNALHVLEEPLAIDEQRTRPTSTSFAERLNAALKNKIK